MAAGFENSISELSKLDLWYKVSDGVRLNLTDVPELIRLRWLYFRDNWQFLKESYISKIPDYSDPNKLKLEIDLFSEFIESQRNYSINRNPFDSESILYRFFSIFDLTSVYDISLSFEEVNILSTKINSIRNMTRRDFLEMRGKIVQDRDAIADRVGLSDPDYNSTYDRSSQPYRTAVKNKDINNMFELQQAIKSIDYILANYFTTERLAVDPFAIARSNANNPLIDIGNYSSGVLVKMQYGENLQSLAKRTLGTPDKWIDIAIANGLKPPYIDEIGYKIPLISNGSKNQINIAGKDSFQNANIDKVYVGQVLFLKSDIENSTEQRSIINIRQVPISDEIIIELDGVQDLDRYKIGDNANIRVYRPNTTNSSFYILIPTDEQIEPEVKNGTPWFLKSSDAVEKKQKIDINISDDGDINFNSTGDLQLSYGLDNSIQAIKLKMSVESGELKRHPSFGLISVAGAGSTDVESTKRSLTSSIVDSITADSRFSMVESISVDYSNPKDAESPSYFSINISVRLSGSNQLVPISFNIRG
jgi:hypothetical protein